MQFLLVIRVFAFIAFLFLPSIAVLLFMGFVVRDTLYFGGFGLVTLVANGIFVLLPPVRALITSHFRRMTKQP